MWFETRLEKSSPLSTVFNVLLCLMQVVKFWQATERRWCLLNIMFWHLCHDLWAVLEMKDFILWRDVTSTIKLEGDASCHWLDQTVTAVGEDMLFYIYTLYSVTEHTCVTFTWGISVCQWASSLCTVARVCLYIRCCRRWDSDWAESWLFFFLLCSMCHAPKMKQFNKPVLLL